MKTANYGVSLNYKGKRLIWGNRTNYFADFDKRSAERLAKSFNELFKLGQLLLPGKSLNARAVKVYHGKEYTVVENAGNGKLRVIKRTHAG